MKVSKMFIATMFLLLLNSLIYANSVELLSSGDEKSGFIKTGEWKYYKVTSSPEDKKIVVTLSGLTDDVDLYVKNGSLPLNNSYDCRPSSQGKTSEICSFSLSNLDKNTYIGVTGYTEGNYTIGVTLSSSEYQDSSNIKKLTLDTTGAKVSDTVQELTLLSYEIEPMAGKTAKITMTPTGKKLVNSGSTSYVYEYNLDLYLRKNLLFNATSYDCHPFKTGNTPEVCIVDLNSKVYLGIGATVGETSPFNMNIEIFSGDEIKNQIIELYVTTFNRAPDKAGLDYWLNEMYYNNWTNETVAKSMFDNPETKEAYPDTLTTEDFMNKIYNNVFNRNIDEAGKNYWKAELESGNISKEKFIIAILNGAKENNSSNSLDDVNTINNKREVGKYFALTKGFDDVTLAKSIMSSVDKNSTSKDDANAKLNKIYSVPLKPITGVIVDSSWTLKNSFMNKETNDKGLYFTFKNTQPIKDGNGINVVAARAGKIIEIVNDQNNSSCEAETRNYVKIEHDDNSTAYYGYLIDKSITVAKDEEVEAGKVLGLASGCSTAPQFYFEVRDNKNNIIDLVSEKLIGFTYKKTEETKK